MSLWPKSSTFSSSHKRMHAVSSIHNLSPACVYLASFFTVVNWTITLSFSVISLETSSQATSCFLLQKCCDSLFNTVKSWTYYVKHHVLALFIFLYSANMSWSFSLTELFFFFLIVFAWVVMQPLSCLIWKTINHNLSIYWGKVSCS